MVATAQTGDPRFEVLRASSPRLPAEQVKLGDLDADGDLDALILALSPFPEEHGWFLARNDGQGVFLSVPLAHLIDGSTPAEYELADLDRDGDTDALMATGNGLVLLRNDGAAGLVRIDSPFASTSPLSLAVGDVDGDGDLDALLVSNNPTRLRLARNRGDGTFDSPETILAATIQVGRLALGDFDGDGDLDLVHGGRFLEGALEVLWNDGSGVFAAGPSVVLGSSCCTSRNSSLVAGDLNGDGRTDVVLQSGGGGFLLGSVHVFLNTGAGSFVEAQGGLPVPPLASGLALADVDGDRALDLWLGASTWLRNRGDAVFEEGFELSTHAFRSAPAGDVDGDGDVDLLLDGRVVLQGPRGTFHDPDPVAVGGPLADLDGDGDLDTLGSRNDGSGVFELPTECWGPRPPAQANAALASDLDQDGDVDVFFFGRAAGLGDSISLNSGAGCLTPSPCTLPQRPGPEFTIDAALGDLDGDGDVDLYQARLHQVTTFDGRIELQPAPASVWSNDGSGCLTRLPGALPATLRLAFGVDLGDVDADGDLDVVTSGAVLYRNGSSGTFTEDLAAFAPGSGGIAVRLGDLDGDGDLDTCFEAARIGVNDGTGSFQGVTSPHPPLGADGDVRLGDLDGDGDLDIVQGESRLLGRTDLRHRIRPYLNRGGLAFQPIAFPSSSVGRFALGDVDRDGDLDVVGGQVFSNLRRSLARRAAARPGRTLVLELDGSVGASYALLGSLERQAPLPTSLGDLHLDLGRVFATRSGRLDGAGEGAESFALPADLSLVGREAAWQAAIGRPLRLSNLEITRVEGY